MNQKNLKFLRKAVRLGVKRDLCIPETLYVPEERTRRNKEFPMGLYPDGSKKVLVIQTVTLRVHPDCARGRYRQLKRKYA